MVVSKAQLVEYACCLGTSYSWGVCGQGGGRGRGGGGLLARDLLRGEGDGGRGGCLRSLEQLHLCNGRHKSAPIDRDVADSQCQQ